MSTYYRLLREAAGVSATPETPLPRSELIRAVSRLHAEMMDLESDADKQLRQERLKHLETWSKAAGKEQDMLAKLEETRGKNRRTAIMALQNDVANIRDNFTQLADTVNPTLQRAYDNAAAAGSAAAAAGNKDAAAVLAWSSLLGELMNAGELNEANLQLHNIFAQMDRGGFGSIADLQDVLARNPDMDPNSNLGRKARAAAEIAEAAYAQKIAAQTRMQDSLGGLSGIIETMTNADTNANLDGLIQQASKYVNTFYDDANRFQPKSPSDAANDLNVYLAGNDAYQEHREAVARLEGYLKSPDGTDIRQQIASVIGDPNFRDWAASNGWKIGKAQLDPTTGQWLYVQGKDDARALRTYEYQLKHDPQQLIRDYNTKTWVAVTTRGTGDDVQLVGAASMPLLQAAMGGGEGDSAATSAPLYASTVNEAGETVYLTGEQLDAVMTARESAIPLPLRVFQHTENDKLYTYLYDPTNGAIYAHDAKTGKWTPSTRKLAELGYDANTILGAPFASILSPDGSYFAIDRANIGDYFVEDTVPTSPDEFLALQGAAAKDELTSAGITLSTEPPPAPTYVTYGKLIRRHATDPQGSVRVSTLGGEVLIPPEEVVSVETTARASDTSPLDVRDRLRGLTNERIAARLPHPTGEYIPNALDKIAATAEGDHVQPLPGPRVTPAKVAGQEPYTDGFGTGTFMDKPDLPPADVPPIAAMSGVPTPTPEQVLRGTRTLSDTPPGSRSALDETLDYRAAQPPITPPPTVSRNEAPPPPNTPARVLSEVEKQRRRIAASYPDVAPYSTVDVLGDEAGSGEMSGEGEGETSSAASSPGEGSGASTPTTPATPPAAVETSGGEEAVETSPPATPATPAAPATPATPDSAYLDRLRAIVGRLGQRRAPAADEAAPSDATPAPASTAASTTPAPDPLAARRAHVETASKGLATLDAEGFVVAKDGSAYITDQLYSDKKRIPYEKFVARYPETSATPPSASPPATPATPPAAPPPKPPPARLPPPKPAELGSLQYDEIQRLRPLVEKKSSGASTVDDAGVLVPRKSAPQPAAAAPPRAPTPSPAPATSPLPPPVPETRYPQWNNRTLKEQQAYLQSMTRTSPAGVRARAGLKGDDEEYQDVPLSDLPAWMTDPNVPRPPPPPPPPPPATPSVSSAPAPTPPSTPWETVLKRRPVATG